LRAEQPQIVLKQTTSRHRGKELCSF
jgi:hypothetical protein